MTWSATCWDSYLSRSFQDLCGTVMMMVLVMKLKATAARRRLVISRPNPKLATKRKWQVLCYSRTDPSNGGNLNGRHR
jgi:hypothetical protein